MQRVMCDELFAAIATNITPCAPYRDTETQLGFTEQTFKFAKGTLCRTKFDGSVGLWRASREYKCGFTTYIEMSGTNGDRRPKLRLDYKDNKHKQQIETQTKKAKVIKTNGRI